MQSISRLIAVLCLLASISLTHALSIFNNPYEYASAYEDVESHLQYLNARYYHPAISRFISRDSYKLMNRYAYASGNPIINIDPSGHNDYSTLVHGVSILPSLLSFGRLTKSMGELFEKVNKDTWSKFWAKGSFAASDFFFLTTIAANSWATYEAKNNQPREENIATAVASFTTFAGYLFFMLGAYAANLQILSRSFSTTAAHTTSVSAGLLGAPMLAIALDHHTWWTNWEYGGFATSLGSATQQGLTTVIVWSIIYDNLNSISPSEYIPASGTPTPAPTDD